MFTLLISLLSFPGVMLHEWSHQFFCHRFRVPVLKVVYFRFGNPMGYVIHAEADSLSAAFWIGIGPLIINSLFALALGQVSLYFHNWTNYTLLWLSFSFAFHALPSIQDASNILAKNHSLLRRGRLQYILLWPIIALVYLLLWLANKLKYLSLDFIYALTLLYLSGALKF